MKTELQIQQAANRAARTLKAVLKRPSSPDTTQQAVVLRSAIGMAHWALDESSREATAIQEFLSTVGTIFQLDGEQN